jgi:uncharacterized protein YoxC
MMIASVGNIIRDILFIVLILCIPLLSIFAIRLLLKLSRSFEHLNKTLDDARPQLNMLLTNLNTTVEDMNGELGKVIDLTSEVQEMVDRLDSSMQTLDFAIKSPAVRYGSLAAGALATSVLLRKRGRKSRKQPGKHEKKR